jgi:predicted anti-sigma-YlaC factor YlaD
LVAESGRERFATFFEKCNRGNSGADSIDSIGVDCQMCREAVSARIDGEPDPVPAEQTDEHLRDCVECRLWQEQALDVTRLVRVRSVTHTPDLAGAVMDKAAMSANIRSRWSSLALGIVALAQLCLGLTQVFGMEPSGALAEHSAGSVSGHLFNESTAWNLAIGIGLCWGVFRPRAAAGLVPVLGGFALVLLGFSAHDLITGAAPISRVAGHGVLLAGVALLVVRHRRHRGPAPGRGDSVPVFDPTDGDEQPESGRPDSAGPVHDRRPLRSVRRCRAA